ncbi:ependymin-like [Gigantopelta aegis]|uniref:ependymin-like n=1 Tax=Gigantopelta aegis TaxID=1735272 RepID=UPI001B88B2DF|nr:ependymin-like [Gigantopelta aegis]
MKLLVFTLCVVFVAAQKPHPCESPKQFEGRFGRFDRVRKLEVFGKFAYDDINRRYREFEFIQTGSKSEFYDKLFLHNEGFEYSMNLRTRICNKTAITWPFRPYAVPPDANFRGTSVLGPSNLGRQHVTINIFDGKTPEGNIYYAITTGEDCYPVTFTFFDKKTGETDRENFFDISLGISDPEAFIPPRGCPP